jgi:uncharacterized repeat protein (TIGR01451 family)
VTKECNWNGEQQLECRIRVGNFGDQQASGVVLTDTLPLSTTLESVMNFEGMLQ